jgi:hypothetical protein
MPRPAPVTTAALPSTLNLSVITGTGYLGRVVTPGSGV